MYASFARRARLDLGLRATPRGQGISRDGEPVLNLNFQISNLNLVSRHA
jgi:hypothetical protein